MTGEEALLARLLADATLAALVGDRIGPVQTVQAGSQPAVSYQVISWPRMYSQDGEAWRTPRIQYTVTATTYAAMRAAAAALTDALSALQFTTDGVQYTCFVENEIDGLAPESQEAGIYVRRIDVVVQH